jgi:hypothetical protein
MSDVEKRYILIMKRFGLVMCALLVSVTLWAQSDAYKEFGKRYDRKGYEVSTVGRTAIRMAALAGDKESREIMRKFDLLVSIKREGGEDEVLHEDFERLVDGYECVGDYSAESGRAWLYMNSARTGFAMYMTTPEEQSVLLLSGRELNLDDLLPPQMQEITN